MKSLVKTTLTSAILVCSVSSAFSEEMRFVQKLQGLKLAQEAGSPEEEVEEPVAPETEPSVDYPPSVSYNFASASGMRVTESVSGNTYDFSAAYALDDDGLPALVPKTSYNLLPSHTFDNASEWDVSIQFAPPYVTPINKYYGMNYQFIGNSSRHSFGIYRDGGNSDGFVIQYPSGKRHKAYLEEGYTHNVWIDGVRFRQERTSNLIRVQRPILEPIQSIRWNRTGDRVFIYLNGELIVNYVADEELDVINGTYNFSPYTSNGAYVNENLLIRSITVSTK